MSTIRRATLATAVVSAALALTACGPTGSDAAGGGAGTGPTTTAAPTATATATGTAAPTATTAPTKTAAPPKTAAPAKTAKPAKPPTDPDYDVFPCSTFDVTFSADLAEKTTGSYLLKITNKSGKPCRVLGHPIVTFGALGGAAIQRGTAPSLEDSIRLEPGKSAYSGLAGGLPDGKGTTVDSIAMTMDTESDLTQKPLKASTPGLYVSPDKNSVTAWMDNAEDALTL